MINDFQIRDWLTVEEEMLRQQAVVVGDVDEIIQLIDKQKVSFRKFLLSPFLFANNNFADCFRTDDRRRSRLKFSNEKRALQSSRQRSSVSI